MKFEITQFIPWDQEELKTKPKPKPAAQISYQQG